MYINIRDNFFKVTVYACFKHAFSVAGVLMRIRPANAHLAMCIRPARKKERNTMWITVTTPLRLSSQFVDCHGMYPLVGPPSLQNLPMIMCERVLFNYFSVQPPTCTVPFSDITAAASRGTRVL